ncbi:MAG: holo-ACP synthase [candidate division KSB1 bacterium]|nr:holo-ACP synthase [candidate division KSB1 bacterium]MDZ7367352.1 holo-ACP synthase [candidate division KSB1 bacterium]MDZ7405233.1 holo-ACP synthase [candidate division KSB1 bacterium]
MICGLGIDLVEISRIEQMLARWPERFVQRVFAPEEIALCESRSHRAAAFAARFAAKEAFSKALGTGVDKNFSWKEFAVHNHANGRPQASLSPRLTKRLQGITVHVSLSHSDHYAAAVVILEKENGKPN